MQEYQAFKKNVYYLMSFWKYIDKRVEKETETKLNVPKLLALLNIISRVGT